MESSRPDPSHALPSRVLTQEDGGEIPSPNYNNYLSVDAFNDHHYYCIHDNISCGDDACPLNDYPKNLSVEDYP